jgi:hypothetical protein
MAFGAFCALSLRSSRLALSVSAPPTRASNPAAGHNSSIRLTPLLYTGSVWETQNGNPG